LRKTVPWQACHQENTVAADTICPDTGDHNEIGQAVSGAETVEILEVIDITSG
jgi:hypothetical protein